MLPLAFGLVTKQNNLLLSYALIIPAGFGCKKSTPHGMLFDFAVKLFVENYSQP